MQREHPRVRGENVELLAAYWAAMGNIPACAGKTFSQGIR